MSELLTVSKKTKVHQSAVTENLSINFHYEVEEGKPINMITARAVRPEEEGDTRMIIDVSYYPSTQNLQIVCHNKPVDFDASVINEIIGFIDTIEQEGQ